MISMNPFYVYAPRGGMVGYRQMTTGEHTVAQQVNSKVSLSLPLIFRYFLSIRNAQS
jgi:intergrase/recombinase